MGPTPQCQPGPAPPQRADRDKRRRTRPTQATEARDKPHPCQPPVPLGVRRQIKQRAPWLLSYRACMVSHDRGGGASTPRASLSTRPSKAGTQLAEEGSSEGDRLSETSKNPTSSAGANPRRRGTSRWPHGGGGRGHPIESQARLWHHQERTRTADGHDIVVKTTCARRRPLGTA